MNATSSKQERIERSKEVKGIKNRLNKCWKQNIQHLVRIKFDLRSWTKIRLVLENGWHTQWIKDFLHGLVKCPSTWLHSVARGFVEGHMCCVEFHFVLFCIVPFAFVLLLQHTYLLLVVFERLRGEWHTLIVLILAMTPVHPFWSQVKPHPVLIIWRLSM